MEKLLSSHWGVVSAANHISSSWKVHFYMAYKPKARKTIVALAR
jgi:hypothetical protein